MTKRRALPLAIAVLALVAANGSCASSNQGKYWSTSRLFWGLCRGPFAFTLIEGGWDRPPLTYIVITTAMAVVPLAVFARTGSRAALVVGWFFWFFWGYYDLIGASI